MLMQILALPLLALKAITSTFFQPDPIEELIRGERVKAQRFAHWIQ